jgi:hypothetical protein
MTQLEPAFALFIGYNTSVIARQVDTIMNIFEDVTEEIKGHIHSPCKSVLH